MLHIVNRSPLNTTAFDTLARIARDGALLLIEDAVYAATRGNSAESALRGIGARVKLHVLGPDLEARGVAERVIDGVIIVDYGGFVDLVAEHPACQSWL